jgi:SOS-response transcriptional repressor LexA
MRKPLTENQLKVYRYIRKQYEKGDAFPSYALISRKFGNASPNSANVVVKQLIKKGWLDKVDDTKPAYKLKDVYIIVLDDYEKLELEEK